MLTQEIATAYTLQCPACGKEYHATSLQTFATCCHQPLITLYQLSGVSKRDINTGIESMWRYACMLPVAHNEIVSLGEGWTRIHSLPKIADKYGLNTVLLKDESTNPTGSFKARGISVAVSKAIALGIAHAVVPTAGNAGGALAAYAAKAGMKATIIMPKHSAETLKEECRLYGAELILLDGLIDSCGKLAKKLAEEKGYFDFSTMKEPYRIEGKKTIGYEIAEQLQWQLPEVIIYPTGGGTGLIGMWKAFKEMRGMGWIRGSLPRMVIVQSKQCAPMEHYYNNGSNNGVLGADYVPSASAAYGLAVPYPFAKDLMLQVLKESNGTVVTVSEKAIEDGIEEIASAEGFLLSPEGSATCEALKILVQNEWIKEEERVLLFNTGSWYKYR